MVQVAFASDIEMIEDREIDSLLLASDELSCKNLFIITWDYEGKRLVSGKTIVFMPLWKWLIVEDKT